MGKQQSKVNQFCKPLCTGQALEDVVKVPVSEDGGDICKLPLLCLTGVVLVPGQTLPLHLFQSSQALMVRRVAENNEVFGVVTERFVSPNEGHVRSSIGTTVEIQSVDEESISSSVKVKGIGCKRFQVINSQRQIDGSVLGTVRMLAERELPPLLESIMLASERRQLRQPCCETIGHQTVKRRKKLGRFSAADFTHWPSWVYEQYDTRAVMTNIQKELAACNSTLNPASQSKGPVEYSFWLMANLPIDDKMKLSLLRIDSTVQRLRCELGILKSCAVIYCKDCGLFIADKRDVFSMANDGPLGMYTNPGGYIHEMITVYRAEGLKTVGSPSMENTWFEGFAWTVVQCRNCTAHIGWKFTAQRRNLCLEKFWGVCRSAVLPGIRQDPPLEADLCQLTI